MADRVFYGAPVNVKQIITTSGAPSGPPTGVPAYKVSDTATGQDGTQWVCTVAGSPGTWTQVGSVLSGATATTTVTATATTGTISLDPTVGNIFTVVPTNAITYNAASQRAGQPLTLIVTTSGTSSFVITFGTGFKSTGTLATGTSSAKVFTIGFIGDGTNFNEVSRTTAM